MQSLVIRAALPLDETTVLPLAEAFHREDGHPLAPSGPATIGALLRGSPLGEIFLLEEAGLNLGYFVLCYTMSVEFGGLVVILDDLYLLPQARGRGVGRAVIAKIEAIAREKKAVQVFLEVEKANARALNFYRQHGWRIRERHMLEKLL
jgi:ribosomal protein S18 acetylase RimI-like enzyme